VAHREQHLIQEVIIFPEREPLEYRVKTAAVAAAAVVVVRKDVSPQSYTLTLEILSVMFLDLAPAAAVVVKAVREALLQPVGQALGLLLGFLFGLMELMAL
jgi:hypothetical protein